MRRSSWLVLAILLAATAIRLTHVSQMSLRGDEAANVLLATQEPSEIIRPFIAEDPHLPLFFWLLHYWMLLAGRSELAVRYPSIFAGVIVVALVYALGRAILPKDQKVAATALLLAAINPYLVWDAQDAYMYSFLTAVTGISFIAFVRVMQRCAGVTDWLGYIAANALGLFVHYLAGLVIVAQAFLWLVWSVTRRISPRRMIEWIAAQGLTLLIFLPWLFFVLPFLARFQLSFFPAADPLEMLGRSLIAFSVGRADSRLMPPMVDPLVGGILSLGFFAIFALGFWELDVKTRIILATYLGLPLVSIFLFSILRFPIFDERYVLFLIPPFLLVLAQGLVAVQRVDRLKPVFVAAIVLILAASGYSLNNYFNVPAFAKSPDWRGLTQQLVAQVAAGDVLIQNYPDPALPYYLQERVPRVLLPRHTTDSAAAVDADLDQLTSKYQRLWLQPAPHGDWDTEGRVAAWLTRHARLQMSSAFRGLELDLYLPTTVALRTARSLDATFSNQVQLLAFDLDPSTGTLQPGTSLRVILYWRALDRVQREATVFVHLYGADGRLWSQQDRQPVDGSYPMTLWESGSVVVDSHVLQIPSDAPAGVYSLMAGMYVTQTLERIGVTNSRGQEYAERRVELMSHEVK